MHHHQRNAWMFQDRSLLFISAGETSSGLTLIWSWSSFWLFASSRHPSKNHWTNQVLTHLSQNHFPPFSKYRPMLSYWIDVRYSSAFWNSPGVWAYTAAWNWSYISDISLWVKPFLLSRRRSTALKAWKWQSRWVAFGKASLMEQFLRSPCPSKQHVLPKRHCSKQQSSYIRFNNKLMRS